MSLDTPESVSEDFRQAVIADLQKSSRERGRPGYAPEIKGREQVMLVVGQYILDQKIDILTFSKMLDYMGDVYDQGIFFSVMKRRYSGEETGRNAVYGQLRKKIINTLDHIPVDIHNDEQFLAFKRLYFTILPHDSKYIPSTLVQFLWKIQYGEDREGYLPINMPRQMVINHIRAQLPKIR